MMENKRPQYKQHKFTRERMWSVEGFHPMNIQFSAFCVFFFWSRPITFAYVNLGVAIRQQNEHYIWHYEAFSVVAFEKY